MMKKLICILLAVLLMVPFTACGKEQTQLAVPTNVQVSNSALITWDEVQNAEEYIVTIDGSPVTVKTNSYQADASAASFTYSIVACAKDYKNSNSTEVFTYTKSVTPPIPPVDNVTVAISGSSEIRSGQSINLTANVTGTINKTVTWKITAGQEYASISSKGVLTAVESDSERMITVEARSIVDSTAFATKIITLVTKPTLTQAMLDDLNVDKVAFDGFVVISVYTIGLFEDLYTTNTTDIRTAMDGTNWYASYENATTGSMADLYYQNHENTACQVGVSFMNDEEYYPMEDDDGNDISWESAGLYNNFKGLTVSDFTFNTSTWRYEYSGNDSNLAARMIASANPYDFVENGFSLIIAEGEVAGIYAKSDYDYTVAVGYKSIQELHVAISYGDSVEVPTISKYAHEPIHDDLQTAINNMHALESYTLNFKEITASYMTPNTYEQRGFVETITSTDCYFQPYTVSYNAQNEEIHTFVENGEYGYQKRGDNLYNTFMRQQDGSYAANRAYATDFSNAKPSFAFAPEIFRSYYIDTENGTTTYYVDDLMSPVASTFYYGVGNDINLYGIFATRGVTSPTSSFTPYVVVKDGYIVEACFYFYIGSIYGVVELEYSDFNSATLPVSDIEFETRQVPSSWDELNIEVTTGEEGDVSKNALEYFKTYFEDDNIAEKLPFFGVPLGDTYGFGFTDFHMPGGTTNAVPSIMFYYDVPLDIDYTINSSLRLIEDYLVSIGYVKNAYGEFVKDNIYVLPVDNSLDLNIYVWKA